MSKISSNPLDNMDSSELTVKEKIEQAGYADIAIGPWVSDIIDNSSPHVTKSIIEFHLHLCRVAVSGLGYMPHDTDPVYQEGFNTLVGQSQVFNLDKKNLVLTIDEERLKSLNEIKKVQQAQSNYHTVHNLDKLKITREVKQYRRVRKKITFVHDKVLVAPILAEKENTLMPFRIRDSAHSNPENDTVINITNVVFNAIRALAELSSTGTKERNGVFIRGLYRNLLTAIENHDNETYTFQDICVFFEKEKNETYKKYEEVMRSIYDKVGVKQPRKIGFKNSPSIIGAQVHDYLNSEAPDAVLARELIEHYNIVDII